MNHQAEKLVQPATEEDAARLDRFDGMLVLLFACPGCGWIESRRADDEPPASA